MPGKPEPWHVAVSAQGGKPRIRLGKASRHYQIRVGRAAWAAYLVAGLGQTTGPVEVRVVAVFRRVKRLKGHGRHCHAVAPDSDKVLRNVLDGLHQRTPAGNRKPKAGIITDDSRVVSVTISKWYAAEGEEPHTEVSIRPWRE